MGTVIGSNWIYALRNKRLPQTGKGLLRSNICFVDVPPENVNVLLHVTELQRLNTGDSDTRANIAHKIEDAGGVPHPFSGDFIIAHGGEWDENQSQAGPLQDQRPGEVPEANVQTEEGDLEHGSRCQ